MTYVNHVQGFIFSALAKASWSVPLLATTAPFKILFHCWVFHPPNMSQHPHVVSVLLPQVWLRLAPVLCFVLAPLDWSFRWAEVWQKSGLNLLLLRIPLLSQSLSCWAQLFVFEPRGVNQAQNQAKIRIKCSEGNYYCGLCFIEPQIMYNNIGTLSLNKRSRFLISSQCTL